MRKGILRNALGLVAALHPEQSGTHCCACFSCAVLVLFCAHTYLAKALQQLPVLARIPRLNYILATIKTQEVDQLLHPRPS